ncbi:MAG: efflux RND transporter periplasmic adaptor subunit [Steroidobacteraceae bacterium]
MKVTSALLLAALAALGACSRTAGQAGAPAAPEVGVMTLAPEPVELSTELAGRTAAFRIAEVRPQVEGIIQRRLFTEGAEVRAGQPLYQIDAAPYRAAAVRAQAGVASSEAQLNAAQLLAERSGTLVQTGVVSKQDNDNAAAAGRSAAAAVEAAKAQLESARIDLAYTQVRSPISGRIGRSLVTEGALVTKSQGDPLATVAQLDPIYVDVTQSSSELLRLQRDFAAGRLQRNGADKARVTLTLEDGSRYPHEGSLQFTEVTVDPGTGSVLLRAQFPNPDRVLLPGMFVRARLEQGSNGQALLLPQAAVSRNARGEATVLVVEAGDKVAERVIQVDRAIGNRWLVAGGVEAGERVVVEGLQKARPGQTVKPMPATAQDTAAPAAAAG